MIHFWITNVGFTNGIIGGLMRKPKHLSACAGFAGVLVAAALCVGVSAAPAYADDAQIVPQATYTTESGTKVEGTRNTSYANQVITIVNQERAKAGLPALKADSELNENAMMRATECAVVFDHKRPDGSQWWTINEERCNGENIAKGQLTPAQVVASWMNSQTHRDNILSKDFKYIGVGCFTKGNNTYWVQLFSVTAPKGGTTTNKPSATTKPSTTTKPSQTQTPTQSQKVNGTWKKSGNRWWYAYSNGSYARGWKQIDNKWYCFDASGWMLTGWAKIGGSWYYLNSSGAMVTGWLKINSTWYYLNSSGAMLTGWAQVGGKWYYLNSSGVMATGWTKVSGSWYYLNSSGVMCTGWQKIGSSWYFLKSSGAMATGWAQVGGKWYYLNSSGVMQSSKWISGTYWVGSNGVMATNTWVDGGRYYVGGNGAWIRR